jgi:hypothetical protein
MKPPRHWSSEIGDFTVGKSADYVVMKAGSSSVPALFMPGAASVTELRVGGEVVFRPEP